MVIHSLIDVPWIICDICSSVISFFLICMCNVAFSTVLLYCFVTLVRLSLVNNKGYLLTYLLTYLCPTIP